MEPSLELPEDPTLSVLRTVGGGTCDKEPATDAPSVLFISLYTFKSFPVRGFHTLARKAGIRSTALFFKDNLTNRHKPISDAEIDHLKKVIQDTQPRMIALSVLAPYAVSARRVFAAIREITDAPVIAGGKHPTIVPEGALSYADYVCKGEGELVLLDIFARLKDGKTDLTGIPGLWHRNKDGAVVDMGQRHLIQELDLIPFQSVGEPHMVFIEHDTLSTHDPELDNDEIWMMAGRGCVYLCSYCVNSVLIPMNRGNGRFVRLRSPDNVIAEIRMLQTRQKAADQVCFNDEVFGVFDDWTAEFAEKYKKEVGIPFYCELVPKLIKAHNVATLADAGLSELHFGIQSGSDEVRNEVLRRPGENRELLAKARLLDDNGVKVVSDLILENPFDDADAMAETIRLLLAMPRPLRLNTYKMQFFPNYPLSRRALDAGFITEDDLTDEKVADGVMYNFVFKPHVRTLDPKRVLENCVYVIPWDSALVRWLSRSLAKRPRSPLALLANGLAWIRYKTDFEQVPVLIWARRIYLGLRMLARGDLGRLGNRVKAVFSKAHPA